MAEIPIDARRWQWLIWSKDGPGHVAQRAILQVLFDYHVGSKGRGIFPSEATIAERAGVSERTARGHLAALDKAGWLSRQHRATGGGQGWRRYQYTLCFPAHLHPAQDPWLKAVEEKRQDARAEYRAGEGWEPRTEDEARRRAAAGDEEAEAWLAERAALASE